MNKKQTKNKGEKPSHDLKSKCLEHHSHLRNLLFYTDELVNPYNVKQQASFCITDSLPIYGSSFYRKEIKKILF